jgi:hypothetical protein
MRRRLSAQIGAQHIASFAEVVEYKPPPPI